MMLRLSAGFHTRPPLGGGEDMTHTQQQKRGERDLTLGGGGEEF